MNLTTIFRFLAIIFRSGFSRSLSESSDNLPMFCRNLPIPSPVEAILDHPAFIWCTVIINRNALELS